MKPNVALNAPLIGAVRQSVNYGLGEFMAKYRRRDRAVSVGSEHTPVQFRGERPE